MSTRSTTTRIGAATVTAAVALPGVLAAPADAFEAPPADAPTLASPSHEAVAAWAASGMDLDSHQVAVRSAALSQTGAEAVDMRDGRIVVRHGLADLAVRRWEELLVEGLLSFEEKGVARPLTVAGDAMETYRQSFAECLFGGSCDLVDEEGLLDDVHRLDCPPAEDVGSAALRSTLRSADMCCNDPEYVDLALYFGVDCNRPDLDWSGSVEAREI